MQKNFNFKLNDYPNNRKYVFYQQDFYQIDKIVEEAVTDCIQYFHGINFRCEYIVKFARGEDAIKEAYFTQETNCRNLFQPNQEQNECNSEIQAYEQGGSGLRIHSIKKVTIKIFRSHSIGAFRYCNFPKPYCTSKIIVIMQNTENKYCFLFCLF